MFRGSRFNLLLLLCAIFVALGGAIASVGPALPELARQTHRSLAQLGTLFIALFGGGLLGQLVVGRIADRFGRRIVLVASCVMFGAGTLAVSLSTHLWAVIAFATLQGFGYAGVGLAVNVISSELAPHRRASTVNLVNVFFAVGAIAGPLVAAATLEWWGTPLPALQISAVLLILLAPIAAFIELPIAPYHEPLLSTSPAGGTAPSAGSALPANITAPAVTHASTSITMPASFVWSCAGLLLLYVGSESSVGSWTPVYLRRSTNLDAAHAATVTAVFWASLCAGRVLATIAGMRMTSDRLLIISFCGAAAGGAALVAGHGVVWLSTIALAILGVSFGPIYPTMMAAVTEAFPRSAGTAASRLAGPASVGGMVFPSLHGFLIARVGTWTSALVTWSVALAMLLAWLVIRRNLSSRTAQPDDDGRSAISSV
jgi:FHS family glucose/mannose:H+ symporter-like MFS transporter